jgi:hypothetical protein
MAWLRRRRRRLKLAPFDRSALPPVEPASFEDMRDEGLLMAEAAGRMRLKNRFIVDALRGDEAYTGERAADSARQVLLDLVEEEHEAADRIAHEREVASQRDGRSQHQHDYHRGDALNLRRREQVYSAVAAELWSRRDDEEYVAGFAERARVAAWDEVAAALEQELDRRWPRFDEEPGYEEARPSRLADFAGDLERALKLAEVRRIAASIPEY